MIPAIISRREPNMTGVKCVVSASLAEELGGDLRVGRAADVEQQARVVRLRRRLRVDAEALAEPHREQRAVQAVLEAAAPMPRSVARRQRRDHLRGTDLFRVRAASSGTRRQ